MTVRMPLSTMAALIISMCLTLFVSGSASSLASRRPVAIDADDIGGVVTGPNGPEAGVWVIAETTDLPTQFVKIVVTDDRGRYLLPDLPKANYNVWVRGYGLVDSPKVQAAPGQDAEPDGGGRARIRARRRSTIRPATGSRCMHVPEKSEFPGNGRGNGISPSIKSQAEWLRSVKSGGCTACHQLGTQGHARDSRRRSARSRRRQPPGSGASSRGRPAPT